MKVLFLNVPNILLLTDTELVNPMSKGILSRINNYFFQDKNRDLYNLLRMNIGVTMGNKLVDSLLIKL